MVLFTQVGDPRDYLPLDVNTRTGSWGKPSDMPANRNVITLTPSSRGGADAVAAAAAALAATYQVRHVCSRRAQGQVQPCLKPFCNFFSESICTC